VGLKVVKERQFLYVKTAQLLQTNTHVLHAIP